MVVRLQVIHGGLGLWFNGELLKGSWSSEEDAVLPRRQKVDAGGSPGGATTIGKAGLNKMGHCGHDEITFFLSSLASLLHGRPHSLDPHHHP